MYPYNRFLPNRPRSIDGQPLDYRTHIDNPRSTYNLYDPKNMKAQVILYWWCRTDFVNFVPMADLHEVLFPHYPEVTKRQMGRTILQATTYDPRKLKGVTKANPKATMCYVWKFREELQYGLEWMLSMWIWRLENDWKAIQDNTDEEHTEMTISIFEDLAACNAADMRGLYADVAGSHHEFAPDESVDWLALWVKYGMEEERATRASPKSGLVLRSFE